MTCIRQKIRHPEAMELYRAGANDNLIAERFGVVQSAVAHWRARHKLPCKGRAHNKMSDSQVRTARRMLRDGASKRQIADAIGVHHRTVQAIRRKMAPDGLRKAGQGQECIRKRVLADNELYPRILRAVGMGLPRDVRHDAANELYADVLEGRLSVDLIEDRAPRYRNWAWSICGSPYGPRSLDAANDDDLSLGDLLEDERALQAMEEAAERAWGKGKMLR